MGTLAPAVADAFGLLQMNLYHLDEAEFLALTCQECTEKDVDSRSGDRHPWVAARPPGAARRQLPDLHVAWPCPVVALIHGLIKDPQRQYVALARRVRDAE